MPVAQKLKGVGGVLGSLISSGTNPPMPDANGNTGRRIAAEWTQAELAEQSAPSARATTPSRMGPKSPPAEADLLARKPASRRIRRKVTLRLSKELIDDYREWSWEERCQLGELVEKAMVQYRKSRSRQKSQ